MSTVKFKTGSGHYLKAEIEAVQIERETESSVWINGRRKSKSSDWECFHDTWEQAHSFLIKRAEIKLAGARRQLQDAQGFDGNVRGMKKPESA